MAFSLKHCILLLVAAVAVCIQLNNAQFIPGARCVCHKTVKYTRENITDFRIIEAGSSCAATQIIVTLETQNNSTESSELCLNPEFKLAKAFVSCWNKINRDETKKVTCLNMRKEKRREVQAKVTPRPTPE